MSRLVHCAIFLASIHQAIHGCEVTVACNGNNDVQLKGSDCMAYNISKDIRLCTKAEGPPSENNSSDRPPRAQLYLSADGCKKQLILKWCNNGQNIGIINQYEIIIMQTEFDATQSTIWFQVSNNLTSIFPLTSRDNACFTYVHGVPDSFDGDTFKVYVYPYPTILDEKYETNFAKKAITLSKCMPQKYTTLSPLTLHTKPATTEPDDDHHELIIALVITGIVMVVVISVAILIFFKLFHLRKMITRDGIQLMIVMSNEEHADSHYMKAAQTFSTRMAATFKVKFLHWEKDDLNILGLGSWFNFNVDNNTKIVLIPSPTLDENSRMSNRTDTLLLRLLHNKQVHVLQFGADKHVQVLEQLTHKQCYKFPEEISKFNRHVLANTLSTFEMQDIIRPLAEIAARIQRRHSRQDGTAVSIETTSLIQQNNNHS